METHLYFVVFEAKVYGPYTWSQMREEMDRLNAYHPGSATAYRVAAEPCE